MLLLCSNFALNHEMTMRNHIESNFHNKMHMGKYDMKAFFQKF